MLRPASRTAAPLHVALTALALAACGDSGVSTTGGSTGSATGTAPGTSTTPDGTDTTNQVPTTGTAPSTTTAGETSTSSPTTAGPDTSTSTSTSSTGETTQPATLSDSSSGGPGSTGGSTGGTTGDGPCPEGTIQCDGDTAQVCDGLGGFSSEEMCPMECAPGLGCVECIPGEGMCNGDTASVCNEEGSGYDDEQCDAVQGVMCEQGVCVGACASASLGTSYIGCEYYSLVTPNVVGTNFTFAVVVSNVSAQEADITVTRGPNMVAAVVVPANTVEVIPLPWINELKTTGSSGVVVDGAYRIRSTQPVTLYQYNPLEYTLNGQFTYTNDASLLMPTNVWGKDTVAIARNTLNGNPGVYTVVAREDNTTITVTPSATGKIINPGGGIQANGTGMAVIGEGDVLRVLSGVGGGEPNTPDVSDITGTRVVSDKPVMVMGAHNCTYIPFNSCCCDHLEELNLPVDNLAKEYLVSTPFVKAPNQAPLIKARMVRIVATEAGTTLTYDPPQNGAPAMLVNAGDYGEVRTDKDFKITASAKIAVSEYILSQQEGGDTGDPAMTISVPIEQYRTTYSFHAPTNYESNFVNITAPTGTKINLDGMPVAGFVTIGGSGYDVVRVQLSNAGDGDHNITGDLPFGVQVYGYGQYTSYWYPGGLDLKVIPQ